MTLGAIAVRLPQAAAAPACGPRAGLSSTAAKAGGASVGHRSALWGGLRSGGRNSGAESSSPAAGTGASDVPAQDPRGGLRSEAAGRSCAGLPGQRRGNGSHARSAWEVNEAGGRVRRREGVAAWYQSGFQFAGEGVPGGSWPFRHRGLRSVFRLRLWFVPSFIRSWLWGDNKWDNPAANRTFSAAPSFIAAFAAAPERTGVFRPAHLMRL
jgi:hypothetical protein